MLPTPYKYYTVDGHLMQDGEIMYRICDSQGALFEKPETIIFHARTGYNGGKVNVNPFMPMHQHYYNLAMAIRDLQFLSNQS